MYYIPYNKNLRDRARELRKNMTPAEEKLWYRFLRKYKFRVHRQKMLGNFIADFYIAKAKLVIEVDGLHHAVSTELARDLERDQFLNSIGIHVARIPNEKIIKQFSHVTKWIDFLVDKYTTPYPPPKEGEPDTQLRYDNFFSKSRVEKPLL